MAKRASPWTRAQARKVIDELERSGLSLAQFGRERGLSAGRLGTWRSRFRREAADAPQEPEEDKGMVELPRMVELVARREPVEGRLHVRCPSGHTVEVHDVDVLEGMYAALTALSEVYGC